MSVATLISKTDLARRTRHVLEQARRGRTMIVESYGEEQVAIVDVLDYRILRAVAAYHALSPHAAPVSDPHMAPRGMDLAEMQQAIVQADGDVQACWNRVLAAYLDADISLGRGAELLGLSRFELADRFQRLGLPLQTGPVTADEAREEFADFGR
jgi:predicted amino acid dehydrogenase